MKTRIAFCFALCLLLRTAVFAGPAEFFQNLGKNVEAETGKEYVLTDANGPWLIYVQSFSGQIGRQEANTLVYELRKSFRLNAYLYEITFVHDVKNDFKKNEAKKKHYLKSGIEQNYAVVVGNFSSLEDNQFKKTLAAVKQCQPKCLQKGSGSSPQPFVRAFGFANPLLPPENQRGTVDKFIESINANRPYTLLRNPRRYTVQIATFTGHTVMQQNQIDEIESGRRAFSNRKMSELEIGEKAAVNLCAYLRKQGIEAYEFHDRYCSMVTVGSFDSYGRELPDGTIQFDPQIAAIIKQYQGQPITSPQKTSYKPVKINGVECDPQPQIIEVPRCRR
ncbi:hypothetical protein FACS189454_03330 [Planctomycetales bacterium]|nr:hypothetical protein FACS189454_03330 [Planctomycetales bacterium]